MSGFPNRFSRSALGPEPEEGRALRSAKRELGASVGSLMLHAVGAVGVMMPMAYLSFTKTDQSGGAYAVGAVALRASGEAWDLDGLFVPTVTRSAAGLYTVTYPSTVTDKDGLTSSIVFRGCTWSALSATAATRVDVAVDWAASPITLRITDRAEGGGAAALADPALFTLVLW